MNSKIYNYLVQKINYHTDIQTDDIFIFEKNTEN